MSEVKNFNKQSDFSMWSDLLIKCIMLWNTKQSADLQHSKERISSCSLFIGHDSLHVTASHSSCRSQVPVAFSSHVSDILHNQGQYMTFNST
jgi:hypothetical protein